MSGSLLIRDVRIDDDTGLDVRVVDGRIAEIGRRLSARVTVLEGRGGALLPGLHDHHIHLLASAAALNSVRLDASTEKGRVADRLRIAAGELRRGGNATDAWLRVIGYHESMAGPLDRDVLDRWMPDLPVRVQYRTGTLWVLNSLALAKVCGGRDAVNAFERDPAGRLTGRLWQGDAWLRTRLHDEQPSLGRIGRLLAECGVTGVTDATATTGEPEAAILASARRQGELPQKLYLMSRGPLRASDDGDFSVGPVKIMLHEAFLPGIDEVVDIVRQARSWNRTVAFHCVTHVELAFALAVLAEGKVVRGDRIEHGGIIEPAAASAVAARGLTVVTQPSFVAERGDTYLDEVDKEDLENLYPCAGLLRRGIPVAASTDAPYSRPDPWEAIAAASTRRTRSGRRLGEREAISPRKALGLFLGGAGDPGGRERRIVPGAPADLCLLGVPLAEALHAPSKEQVAATVVEGNVVFVRQDSASQMRSASPISDMSREEVSLCLGL